MSWLSEIWLYLATALHVAGAALVTAHAVLTKRDVRAAIGWVGLAWLAPIVGSLIYVVLGINRVSTRAQRLLVDKPELARRNRASQIDLDTVPDTIEGAHLISLARLGERLTNRAIEKGNSIVALENGDAAYPAMLAAIDGAKASVALETFIFEYDRTGAAFIEALARARDRGVEVRVLVDGMGTGYFRSPIVRALRARDLEVGRFTHSFMIWRMPFVNMRTHRKILVVDGRIGFTGGMNIADDNVHAYKSGHTIRDLHFQLEGPVVRQLMTAFVEDWAFTTNEVLEGKAWFPALRERGDVIARGIASDPGENLEKLEWTMAGAIGRARKHVRIVTPYFLPEQRLISAITLAALRGVRVDIVVPEKSNHFFMDWAAYAQHDQILTPGARIFLSPPPFAHTKLMSVDDMWVLFGSANWDARSLRLNFEYNVECYDPEAGQAMGAHIDRKIAESRELHHADVDAKPFPVKLRNGLTRLLLPYM